MYADRGDDLIFICIDDTDVMRVGVDDVDFFLLGASGYAGGVQSDGDGFLKAERAQVNDADRVAASVGDVGVLVVEWAAIR